VSIHHFYGADGPSIRVETPEELHEALDILHSQVLDNFGDDKSGPFLRVLEAAMRAMEELGVEP